MLAEQIAFFVLAFVAIASALGVVLSRNGVYSMLNLIINLLSLAAFFLTLQAIFVATIQVLIYAGAVMVLFLFVVTMLSPHAPEGAGAVGAAPERDGPSTDEPRQQWTRMRLDRRQRFQVGAGLGLAIILAVGLIYAVVNGAVAQDIAGGGLAQQVETLGNTEAFGQALFHGFSFPFEVTSVLLVVAVLGAVVLGRRMSGRERE